jgi:hypothetical protein
MQSTLFFLALNPSWQQRVYDEMTLEVFGSDNEEDLDVTHEHINRLEWNAWIGAGKSLCDSILPFRSLGGIWPKKFD